MSSACVSPATTKDRRGEGNLLGALGLCHAELGRSDRALAYYDEALGIAREVGDLGGQATHFTNLGIQYAERGEIAQAIEQYRQALQIDRDLKDRANQALDSCNLGNRYAELGQTKEAREYLNEALAISQDIGYRLIEAATRINLGELFLDEKNWPAAVGSFQAALEIGDETANVQSQQAARIGLAQAHLYAGVLPAARAIAGEARRYNFPLSNHFVAAVLGLVVLRQDDRPAACEAFSSALNQANELLSRNPQRYAALDTKAFALCGLALCENISHIPAAKEAYRAARAIISAPGIVTRVLRAFDALALADPTAILAAVRPYAAGSVTAQSAAT